MDTRIGKLFRRSEASRLDLDLLPRGPSIRGVTSQGLGWTDCILEEQNVEPGEREASVSPYVSLLMWCSANGSGEVNTDGSRFVRYDKRPGAFCLYPAGPVPAIRPFTYSRFLVCAIGPKLVETVELELDRRPTEKMRILTGFHDSALCQLVTLLSAEAAQGGVFGRLYSDSLAQAIATRLLLFNEKNWSPSRFEGSPLPRHLLQRVIERMRDLSADLDLRTLAAETGYSQRHFIRMFRAATGQTPHRYLIQLRLDRAKEFLRQDRASLIDVASACGFSSHAHMTHVFRRMMGVTPSKFRNQASSD
jgi:AraC family transcriptional regulator